MGWLSPLLPVRGTGGRSRADGPPEAATWRPLHRSVAPVASAPVSRACPTACRPVNLLVVLNTVIVVVAPGSARRRPPRPGADGVHGHALGSAPRGGARRRDGPHVADESAAEDAAVDGEPFPADETSFSALAERHRHALRVHCYRMLGSFTEAEDMVQEALLKAWRDRASFQERSTLGAWLYATATNTCLTALPTRRAGSAAREAGASPFTGVAWLQPYPDALLDRAAPAGGGPEGPAIARETVELAFLAAVQHLPPRQRAVLLLRDVLGRPAEEASRALELSVPAVKSALQRARTALRRLLPERRAGWGAATAPGQEERAVLRRYVEASHRADLDGLAVLLREDARQTVPPASLVHDGRAAVLDMWRPSPAGDQAWGDWVSVPLDANRQPAAANYVRMPGEAVHTAVNIDVLRVEDGLVAEITTFGPELLPVFGLPMTR
ncbi:RNA polymerase subunit sigma-70 [Glycomyces fuscus]|nr:RNA polymerase subunit sigma-70 [Glycomyces fuscus]